MNQCAPIEVAITLDILQQSQDIKAIISRTNFNSVKWLNKAVETPKNYKVLMKNFPFVNKQDSHLYLKNQGSI
jgi:hypothetical protein